LQSAIRKLLPKFILDLREFSLWSLYVLEKL